MSFDLSAHLFYGFDLDETGDSNSWRQNVYEGEFDDWEGNRDPSPCATVTCGWHDPIHNVAIRSTIRKARRGDPLAVTIPAIDPAWNEQLRAWCEQYGLSTKNRRGNSPRCIGEIGAREVDMSDILDELDAVVDEEAWEYLDLHYPALADKIRKAIQAGIKPDAIRSRFLRRSGEHRTELACRVENAARHIAAEQARQRG